MQRWIFAGYKWQFDVLNNEQKFKDENIHLFTLDVEKLYPSIYPSIQPGKALKAIRETLSKDEKTEKRIKTALARLIEFCFEESYVTYENNCFKGKIGIPTGGCISRQIADIFFALGLIHTEWTKNRQHSRIIILEEIHRWLFGYLEGDQNAIYELRIKIEQGNE